PECDFHAPLMSLPAILGTTLATLPARVPYLATDPRVVERWRSMLVEAVGIGGDPGPATRGGAGGADPARPFLIGVAWQGSPTHGMDRWRSFPLAQLAPLAELPGVRLVSLQVGHGQDQVRALAGRFPIIELTGRRPRDFLDTAALISQLDLVVAAD